MFRFRLMFSYRFTFWWVRESVCFNIRLRVTVRVRTRVRVLGLGQW